MGKMAYLTRERAAGYSAGPGRPGAGIGLLRLLPPADEKRLHGGVRGADRLAGRLIDKPMGRGRDAGCG